MERFVLQIKDRKDYFDDHFSDVEIKITGT
jgi:hypothetical protein